MAIVAHIPERDRDASRVLIVAGVIHLLIAFALLVVMLWPANAQERECSLPISDTKWVTTQIETTILVLNQAKLCTLLDCTATDARKGADKLVTNLNTRIDLLKRVASCMKAEG